MTEALAVLAGVAVFGVGYIVGRYAGVTAGLRRGRASIRNAAGLDRSLAETARNTRSNPTYDRLTGYDRDRNA